MCACVPGGGYVCLGLRLIQLLVASLILTLALTLTLTLTLNLNPQYILPNPDPNPNANPNPDPDPDPSVHAIFSLSSISFHPHSAIS